MRGARGDLEAIGARLAFVGTGEPQFARAFRDEFVPDCPVYSDTSAATYVAIGARGGLRTIAGPGVITAALRARRGGFRQTHTRGRPLQQGGVVVMLPGDRVGWSYLSRHAGDHPTTDEVVAGARAAVGRSAPA